MEQQNKKGYFFMYKEFIISIFIIILIFIGDFVTQSYTKKNVEDLSKMLSNLKNNLEQKNENEALENIERISNKLDEVHNILAYYIEHDEIEKIETGFTACESFAKTGNHNLAISELEKTEFALGHITDKYSFTLENIF